MGENEKLVSKFRETGDRKYLNRLAELNSGMVYSIARKFFCCTPNSCHDDLVQQGWIGFMIGLRKYDSSFETLFSSYAAIWIRAKIQRYVEWSLPLVRTLSTENSRSVMFKYNKLAAKIRATNPQISDDHLKSIIAEMLGVKEIHVQRVQDSHRHVIELDAPIKNQLGFGNTTMLERLKTDCESPEEHVIQQSEHEKFKRAYDRYISRQSPKKQQAIEMIFFSRMNLAEVGRMTGVTRERIRQIKVDSIQRIREGLNS